MALSEFKGNTAQRLSSDYVKQIFRQIAENDAGILSYFKEFLAKMTENL